MAEQERQGEIHRADPAYRRQMQVVLAATVVLGFAGVAGLQVLLHRVAGQGGADAFIAYEAWLNRLLAGLCLLLAVAAGAFALWLHRVARATALERRWPPATMRTSSDVRVRYLTSADALVAQLRGASIGLALLALALAAWAAWLLRIG
jgi:hypothetical protein